MQAICGNGRLLTLKFFFEVLFIGHLSPQGSEESFSGWTFFRNKHPSLYHRWLEDFTKTELRQMPQMALVNTVGEMMNDVPEEICFALGCWVLVGGGGNDGDVVLAGIAEILVLFFFLNCGWQITCFNLSYIPKDPFQYTVWNCLLDTSHVHTYYILPIFCSFAHEI